MIDEIDENDSSSRIINIWTESWKIQSHQDSSSGYHECLYKLSWLAKKTEKIEWESNTAIFATMSQVFLYIKKNRTQR